MKKTITTGLALLLMAGAASSAMAQDHGGDRQRGGRGPLVRENAAPAGDQGGDRGGGDRRGGDRGGGDRGGGGQRWQRPDRDVQQAAPQAPAARAAPEAQAAPQQRFERRGGQRQGFQQPRASRGVPIPQAALDAQAAQQRARGDDRNRRGDDGRNWNGRDGRDGRDGRNGDGRNDRGERDGRWNNDRNDRGDRHWDNGPRRPIYQSQRRFRGPAYRPPVGFYSRSWNYGEYLPRGWYGSDYRLGDWFAYGLPSPPPGCDWVRVGYDAILVDRFTGEVLEVVRLAFY